MRSEKINDLLAAIAQATDEQQEAALRALKGGDDSKSEEKLISIRQLGCLLGVHPTTIWRWDIPCHHIGTRRRYKLSEALEYLQSQEFADLHGRRKNQIKDNAQTMRSSHE